MNGKEKGVRLVNDIGFLLTITAVFLIVLYYAPFEGRDGLLMTPGMTGAQIMPLPSDLVAHWTFDESSGTVAVDSSATGNDGSLVNGPGWVSGKIDGGLNFDGIDDYVEIAHSDEYLLSEGTVAFWFKTDDNSIGQGFFSKDSSGFDTGGHLTIYLENSKVKVRHQSTSASYLVESGIVQSDTWYHVAFTFGSGGLKLYIDGGAPFVNTAYTGGLLGNREPIAVGAKSWSSGNLVVTPTHTYTDGVIDDVRIYKRALSNLEIDALLSAPPLPPPPPSFPPVTSIFCDGGECSRDPYPDQVSITFSCSDDSGCALTNYCITNCPFGLNCPTVMCQPSPYDPSSVLILHESGKNIVTFSSVDIDDNVEATQTVVVELLSDDTAPFRSSEDPVRIVPRGTTEVSIHVGTDENATCKYSSKAGLAYDDVEMSLFDTTGDSVHSTLVDSLVDGNIYTFYVRCRDGVGNANADDFILSIEVATAEVCGDGFCTTAERNDCVADCAMIRGNVSNITHNFFNIILDVASSDRYYQFYESIVPVKIFEVSDDLSSVERIKFDYSFNSGNPLRLSQIIIEKQESQENHGRLYVSGLDLTDERKSVLVDKLSFSSDAVCIKDVEDASLAKLSPSCSEEFETIVNCDDTVTDSGYKCSIQGDHLEVSGLRHTIVEEYLEICGNNRCDVSEDLRQ